MAIKRTMDDYKDRWSSPIGKFTPPKKTVKKAAPKKTVKKGK